MFDRIFSKLKPKIVLPIAAMIYGCLRIADAYIDSVNAGEPMSGAHLSGYALGVLLVWGFAGLAVGYGLDMIDKRAARKEAEAD